MQIKSIPRNRHPAKTKLCLSYNGIGRILSRAKNY